MTKIASSALVIAFMAFFAIALAPAHGAEIPHVAAAEFSKMINRSDKPVLVQYDATWCPYCKAIQPHLQALARDKQDEIAVIRIDVDEEPEIASEYEIRGLPTLIIYRNGEVMGRYDGVADASELTDWVNDVIY